VNVVSLIGASENPKLARVGLVSQQIDEIQRTLDGRFAAFCRLVIKLVRATIDLLSIWLGLENEGAVVFEDIPVLDENQRNIERPALLNIRWQLKLGTVAFGS
jgi:hypothetical protein